MRLVDNEERAVREVQDPSGDIVPDNLRGRYY
jgi:hypothetical protein